VTSLWTTDMRLVAGFAGGAALFLVGGIVLNTLTGSELAGWIGAIGLAGAYGFGMMKG